MLALLVLSVVSAADPVPKPPPYTVANGFQLERTALKLEDSPERFAFQLDGTIHSGLPKRLPLNGLRGVERLDDRTSDAFGNTFVTQFRQCYHDLNASDLGARKPGAGPAFRGPGFRQSLEIPSVYYITGGLMFYDEPCLPKFFRGRLFSARGPEILATDVIAAGATFRFGDSVTIVKRKPRVDLSFDYPVDFSVRSPTDFLMTAIGPDGAIYIFEMPDGIVYRLSWKGGKTPLGTEVPAIPLRGMDSWAKIVAAPDAELLKTLGADALTDRRIAAEEISRRGTLTKEVLAILADRKAPTLTRLAAFDALVRIPMDAMVPLLADPSADIRRRAADAVSRHGGRAARGEVLMHKALVAAYNSPEPAVRRAVALGIGAVNAPGAAEFLVEAYQFDRGECPVLTDGLAQAIGRTGYMGLHLLIELAHSETDANRRAAVRAFRIIRSRASLPASIELFNIPRLTDEERVELVLAFAESPDLTWDLLPPLREVRDRVKDPSPALIAAFDLTVPKLK